MAFSAQGTKLANLFNPEVIGDMIDTKLVDLIKLAPLAKVDTRLVGNAGDTVKLPYYSYIGDAEVVAEGADIPIKKLTEQTKSVTISKVGNGIQITDEAVLSGYGDPIGQGVYQIALSIASKVDKDLMTALNGNETYTTTLTSAFKAEDVADALTKFGEDLDGDKVLLIDAEGYATLRKSNGWIPNTEAGANIAINGTVGMIYGCQVVVTNRIEGAYHIVKPGALAVYLKRDTFVETDRDIVNKSTVITADKHFATYLLDATKAVKIAKAS